MKINEILILESQQQGIPTELDLLNKIKSGAISAFKDINLDKQGFMELEPENIDDASQQVLDEDWKSTLGKFALAGAIGLTGLNAQASQELGKNLAMCAGAFTTVSALQFKGGNAQAGKTYGDMAVLSLELANQHISKSASDRIAADTLQGIKSRLDRNDKTVVADVQDALAACVNIIDKARSVAKSNSSAAQQKSQAQTQQVPQTVQVKWNSDTAYALGFILGQAEKYGSKMDPRVIKLAKDLEANYKNAKKPQAQAASNGFGNGVSWGYNPSEIEYNLKVLTGSK